MERHRHFFASDAAFFGFTVVSVIMMLYNTTVGIITGYYGDCIFSLIYAFIALGVFITYRRHEKNAMKYLMGMLLGAGIVESLQLLISDFRYFLEGDVFWYSLLIVFAASLVLFAVNHLILSLDHGPKPAFITLSIVCVIVYFLSSVALCITEILEGSTAEILEGLTYLGAPFLSGCVLCVDTKLDVFKAKRQIEKDNGDN